MRHQKFIGLVLSLTLLLLQQLAQAEQITLTTYYPSPKGIYTVLRLYPQATPPASVPCSGGNNEGFLYYDQPSDRVLVCNGTAWTTTGVGGGGATSNLWTLSGSNLYPINLTWKVGIGTQSPSAALHINNTPATTNSWYGIYASTNRPGQTGAYGGYLYATGATDYNYGAYLAADGGNTNRYAYGLYAYGYGGTMYNYGLYGFAYGTGGATNYGVVGKAENGLVNYGFYGMAWSWGTTAGTNYGVYSSVSGPGTNYALYANATGGTQNWGLYVAAGDSYFAGKVGIGTTTPSSYAGLDIRNSEPVGNRGQIITDTYWIRNTTGNAAVPTGGRAWIDHNNDDLFICQYNTVANKGIKFATPFGQVRMTILSSNGYVGIGTETPTMALHVEGNAYKTLGGGQWVYPSDIRLKKNVHPIENALDKLLKLKGVTFQWKEPKEHGSGTYMGMIGQEVEQVFPEWVSTDKQGYKNLNVIGFEALTTEAVKELKRENEFWRAQNNALEMRISKLEQEVKNAK